MRTYNGTNVDIYYPDEVGFAYNPCIVKVIGSMTSSFDVTMNYGSVSQTCTTETRNGIGIVDVRQFIQSFFDELSRDVNYYAWETTDSGKSVDFTVTVRYISGVTLEHEFSVFYIWGGLYYGETYNGFRRLTWFKKFPFTFGLYANNATKILVSPNGSPQKVIELDQRGVWNIPSSEFGGDASTYTIYSYDGEITQATFDLTFDLTFYLSGSAQTKLIQIDVDDADEGVYLRWINRHGFYEYHLFKPGNEARAITADGEYKRNNLLSYDNDYGYQLGAGRRIQYNREDSIEICAPMVDSETFNRLQDVTSSPVVDMLIDRDAEKWIAVTVKAGTYTKTRRVLQDFTATIVLPDYQIQSL